MLLLNDYSLLYWISLPLWHVCLPQYCNLHSALQPETHHVSFCWVKVGALFHNAQYVKIMSITLTELGYSWLPTPVYIGNIMTVSIVKTAIRWQCSYIMKMHHIWNLDSVKLKNNFVVSPGKTLNAKQRDLLMWTFSSASVIHILKLSLLPACFIKGDVLPVFSCNKWWYLCQQQKLNHMHTILCQ